MGKRVKLPVFQTVGESFGYSFKKIPAMTVLVTTTIAIIFLPVILLASLLETGGAIAIPEEMLPLSESVGSAGFTALISTMIIFMIFIILLFYSIIATNIIENVIHGKRLWLFRLSRNTWRYFGGTTIVMGIVAVLEVLVFAGIFARPWIVERFPNYELAATIASFIIVPLAIYLIFRSMLVPVDAVAQSRLSLVKGFRVTRGNTLRLMGLHFLTMAILMTVMFTIQMMTLPFMMISMSELANADSVKPSIEIFKSPAFMIIQTLGFLLWTFIITFMFSTFVFAYKWLTSSGEFSGSED